VADPTPTRKGYKQLYGDPSGKNKSVTPKSALPASGSKLTFEEAMNFPDMFNYLDTNNFGESFDPHWSTMFGALRSIIQEKYIPDAIGNSGPYRAICIDIVDDGTGLKTPGKHPFEPGSPEALITKYTDITIEPRCRIRARVPGIDTMPKPFGALSGKPTPGQMDVIRMHTVFTSDMKRAAPKIGDLIYVDWRYKPKNGPWKDPIYLGRVNDTAGISMEAIMEAFAAFLNACIGAGASGVNSTGNPMSVPKSVKFRPSGRIIVPPDKWAKKGCKYIYFLYEKQVKAENDINKIRAYWDTDKLKKLTVYASHKSGLGAANSWIPWGVMHGECRQRPIGVLGHNPNKGCAYKKPDVGYGMGQFILSKWKATVKSSLGKQHLNHTDGPLSGKAFEHQDLVDPYVSILSIAVSYKRLFNWAADNATMALPPPVGNSGQPTPEAIGAWWACPGHKAKTGEEFKGKCPKGVRKATQVPQYGPQINTVAPTGFQGPSLQKLIQEAETIIAARPIPDYIRYEDWLKEQEALIEAEKEEGVPPEFLGTAFEQGKPMGTKFDLRTMKTLPAQQPGLDGQLYAAPVGKYDGQYGYEVIGAYVQVYSGSGPVTEETGQTPVGTTPVVSPTAPVGKKKADKTEHKPLKDVASQTGASANSTQVAKCPEGFIQAGTYSFGFGQVMPKCVSVDSPEGKKAKKAEAAKKTSTSTTGSTQQTNAALPLTGQPMALEQLCARLAGLGGLSGLMGGGTPNTMPPVPKGGEISVDALKGAYDILNQEAIANNPPIPPKTAGTPGKLKDGRWSRKCLQFAAYLALKAGSSIAKTGSAPGKPWNGVNRGIHNWAPLVKSKDGKRFGVGLTIVELTSKFGPEGDNTLKPGWAVHVKATWTETKHYSPKDDFHHWITYAGNGKWIDSRGGGQTAKKADRFLKNWFRGSYGGPDYVKTREFFANKTKAELPKGAQPRVTGVHNPY